MNYYNEFDPKAAAWLRQLIADGMIPPGDVDERSIADVKPSDLAGYIQCHFFAGIGGWSHALRLAGWPDDRPVWTGSCPCQPFSSAGKGRGVEDERHLWPQFARLIGECKPATIFGEQVASRAGREWLAGVFADLEGMAYRRAGADLCAACVRSPHIRQRLFWVADAEPVRTRPGTGQERAAEVGRDRPAISGEDGGVADAQGPGGWSHAGAIRGWPVAGVRGEERQDKRRASEQAGRTRDSRTIGDWNDFILIPCGDGKSRRIKPGLKPLAHGVPARVVRLRGYGNAIVPQVAAKFIEAYMMEDAPCPPT